MAWTIIHLLIGMTLMAGYSAYCSSAPRTSDRISEPKQRTERIRSRIESRVGDSSRIVFPGPTSDPHPIEIPEHCQKLGICEDVGNFPQDLVRKAIADNRNLQVLQNDQLDLPILPDITQRLGPAEENIELCNLKESIVYPKAAKDPNGNWHVVLNLDDNPLQGFKVEVCETDGSACSPIIAEMQSGYEARCIQKFTYRKMAVLHNGKTLEKTLKIPSCCSCVAKLVIR